MATAKQSLDAYRARAQFQITMTAMGIYCLAVLLFLLVMHKVQADQRLTIAVLLLTPLPGLINSAAAFWLNRARDDGNEKPPPDPVDTDAPAVLGKTPTT